MVWCMTVTIWICAVKIAPCSSFNVRSESVALHSIWNSTFGSKLVRHLDCYMTFVWRLFFPLLAWNSIHFIHTPYTVNFLNTPSPPTVCLFCVSAYNIPLSPFPYFSLLLFRFVFCRCHNRYIYHKRENMCQKHQKQTEFSLSIVKHKENTKKQERENEIHARARRTDLFKIL